MDETSDDRRKEPRYRVKKPGFLRCLVTERQVDVEVQDMSASGARVEVASSTDDMLEVELHIHPEDLRVPARVQWQADDQLGLSINNADATINKTDNEE